MARRCDTRTMKDPPLTRATFVTALNPAPLRHLPLKPPPTTHHPTTPLEKKKRRITQPPPSTPLLLPPKPIADWTGFFFFWPDVITEWLPSFFFVCVNVLESFFLFGFHNDFEAWSPSPRERWGGGRVRVPYPPSSYTPASRCQGRPKRFDQSEARSRSRDPASG